MCADQTGERTGSRGEELLAKFTSPGINSRADLRFRTLPAIQAACVYHKGSYRTFAESYETVLKYIEENGYEIAGEIRESYIDGVWNKDDESQWLSEIQVPIRKKAE